jgi:hypothetical protein
MDLEKVVVWETRSRQGREFETRIDQLFALAGLSGSADSDEKREFQIYVLKCVQPGTLARSVPHAPLT